MPQNAIDINLTTRYRKAMSDNDKIYDFELPVSAKTGTHGLSSCLSAAQNKNPHGSPWGFFSLKDISPISAVLISPYRKFRSKESGKTI